MRRRSGQGGYTLLEVLAVAAIAVALIGVSAVGVRRLRQSDLRAASSKLAGAIKFSYDRAVTTGRYYRLVIDLDQKVYWPEVSDDRFYLVRGHSSSLAGDETDTTQTTGTTKTTGGGGMGSLLGLMGGGANAPSATVAAKVGAAKARFAADPTGRQRSAPLRGVNISAVWTARFDEPVTQGKAFIYFFPEGMTERAIIHLADTSDGVYSLVVHPLTGRVEIFNWRVELPRTGDTDDTGEARP